MKEIDRRAITAFNDTNIPTFEFKDITNVREKLLGKFFFSIPTGDYGAKMPKHVLGKSGHGANERKCSDEHNIYKQVKHYDDKEYTVIRYRRGEETKHLFYAMKNENRPPPAQEIVKKMKIEVQKEPQRFEYPVPIVDNLTPNFFFINKGKNETISVVGAGLFSSEGYLVNDAKPPIKLLRFNGEDLKNYKFDFTQPLDLEASTYHLLLRVFDRVYRIQNFPVQFSEENALLDATPLHSLPVPEYNNDYYHFYNNISPIQELTSAVEYGNTRLFSQFSEPFGENFPETKKQSLSIEELARKSGNLNTILFVAVWKRVSKGKMSFEILQKLQKYVLASTNLTFDGMMKCIPGSETITNPELELRAAAKAALMTLPKVQQINFESIAEQVPVVAVQRGETLETHFTEGAPEMLIDEITQYLLIQPVILPISGWTISLPTYERKPNWDMYANKPFGPGQKIIPNRRIQQELDKYLLSKILPCIKGIPNKSDFVQSLNILLLMWDREDLSFRHEILNSFSQKFWDCFGKLVPFLPSISPSQRSILYKAIRNKMNVKLVTMFLTSDSESEHKKGFVSLFPQPSDAYTVLNIRSMLIEGDASALSLILLLWEFTKVNFLRTFALQESQHIWKVLRTFAKNFTRDQFVLLTSNLPYDADVMDLLLTEDVPPQIAITLASQAYFNLKERKEMQDQISKQAEHIVELSQRLNSLERVLPLFIPDEQSKKNLALVKAASEGLPFIKKLVQSGADINFAEPGRGSAIHLAAGNGHEQCIRDLLECGANIEATDDRKYTPLQYAVKNGNTQVSLALISLGANVNARNKHNRTALHSAAGAGQTEQVKLLIAHNAEVDARSASQSATPLTDATLGGHLGTVKVLLELGANANVNTFNNFTPLHDASSKGFTEIVKLLVQHGAEIEAKTYFQDTPLHAAARNGHTETVKVLVNFGANVNTKNNEQYTPLHFAAEGGYTEIVKILLQKGADKNAKDKDQKKPFARAKKQEIQKLLG